MRSKGSPDSPSRRRANKYTCHRKKKYRDLGKAKRAAENVQIVTGIKTGVYVCGHCGAWHVGKDRRPSVQVIN